MYCLTASCNEPVIRLCYPVRSGTGATASSIADEPQWSSPASFIRLQDGYIRGGLAGPGDESLDAPDEGTSHWTLNPARAHASITESGRQRVARKSERRNSESSQLTTPS